MKKYLVDDTEYYVNTIGSGAVLLFAHGFPFDARLYEEVANRLASKFFCVIPNLRGFGSTPLGANGHNPQGAPRVKMGRFADDLAILASEIACERGAKGERVILCGLSMGGYIALEFARRRPNLLAGLVFCDSNAKPDSPEKALQRRELAESVDQFNVRTIADDMIPNLVAPKTLTDRPEVVSFLREMIVSQSPQAIAAGSRGMSHRADFTEFLPQIVAPTLVLGGEYDKLSPADSLDAIAKAIPNATRATIPNAGHVAPLENPSAFADAILEWSERLAL